VVVMNYPKEIKAFYMRLNDDGKTVAAMDVLAPGIGEIIGGSQREERLDVLDRRIARSAWTRRLLVVPRPAPLRHRAPRRLRPGLRATDPVRHRHGEHPRRDPLPFVDKCFHAGTNRRPNIPCWTAPVHLVRPSCAVHAVCNVDRHRSCNLLRVRAPCIAAESCEVS
jgi:hypothetical protein